MAITIDNESKQYKKSPVDIYLMGERYKTENNLFTFPSPEFTVIEQNLFFLLKNSKQENFAPKYNYRPDYLSFDEYGLPILANLLMFINQVPSIEDFVLDVVIIPTFEAIVEITRFKFREKDISDLQEVAW